ncbi:hypothetical protein Trisim1_012475 [Trichoderma cf. simile WF8]
MIPNFDQISLFFGVLISLFYIDHDVFFSLPIVILRMTPKSMVFASFNLMPAVRNLVPGPPDAWCFGRPLCHSARLCAPGDAHFQPSHPNFWCLRARHFDASCIQLFF